MSRNSKENVMSSLHLMAAVTLSLGAGVAMAQNTSTTTSKTGNSTATVTQSGGGTTTKKVIKGKDGQTVIQQQGGNSAAVTQGSGAVPNSGPKAGSVAGKEVCVEAAGVSVCAPNAAAAPNAPAKKAPDPQAKGASPHSGLQTPRLKSTREQRLATSRARRAGSSSQQQSAYEKRVESQLGIEIAPSAEFRRLFLDKLR